MFRNLSISVFMALALATFAACEQGGEGFKPDLNEGVKDGPCLADGTCNEGLVCENNICVEAPDEGPAAGAEGGACLDDGTCNEGLFCNAETKICASLNLSIPIRPIAPIGPLTGPTIKLLPCPVGMVLIKGGQFQMGSNYSVTVSDFCMDRTEFTNGDKKSLTSTAAFAGFAWPTSPPNFDSDKQPLVMVDWQEAKDICEKQQGKSLPTEAQWEYAAHGGTANKEYGTADGTLHPNGDNACWDPTNTRTTTCAVKSYVPNALGLYDMSGNVWEWVADWYGDYPTGIFTDPTGPSAAPSPEYRVVRGGSWINGNPANLRAANRFIFDPEDRHGRVGFRCVAVPKT